MLRERTFNPYEVKKKWQERLFSNLEETHECHRLTMPNSYWADYEAWKIWFEKMVPFMRDGVVLIGHSLGGSFLFRYLSENKLPIDVAQLHLIAPVILPMEDCEGFYTAIEHWNGFATNIAAVHLWHSEDDTIVPITHSEALKARYESAELHRFTDRFHFIGEEFGELEAVIKS
jgi:predicted alpha/beta hydrolase family esterase